MLSTNDVTVKCGDVADTCERVLQQTQRLVDRVRDAAAGGQPLHQLERDVFDGLLKMGHSLVDMFIELQGDGDLGSTMETLDGRTLHRAEQPKTRRLRTIFGEHRFVQYVYSAGKGKTIELRPLDARMQLPESVYSYLLEEFSQLFCIEQAFELAGRNFATVFGQELSVGTLEAVNHRMAESSADFFESRPVPKASDEGELMVITADGKGVPMVVKPSRDLLPFEDPLERPGNRKMATLGSVYTVDRYVRTPEQFVAALFRENTSGHEADATPHPRPIPYGKQVRAEFTTRDREQEMLIPGPYPIMNWLSEQARKRDRKGRRPLIRLLDGQESLRDVGDMFLDASQSERLVDILDIIHVGGYIWQAAHVFHPHGSAAAETFARERMLRILRGEAASVIRGLRRMGTDHGLIGAKKKTLTRICRYLEKNRDRMRYDEYLAAGYPIATGVIEGACRHLVKDRMERSGMRWTIAGAHAMLQVRAIHINGDWTAYQNFRIAKEQKVLHPPRSCLENKPKSTLNA